ncbi:hypothetical protein [Mycolicibacterium holsaticum]|uniref:hypothetical protein n=1 Tax=Mycolicibacterium holsaticum TaxID=152142 RepID=UPI001041EFB2|nr:hypothetical protein [Mycolicibacterium holsaticum]
MDEKTPDGDDPEVGTDVPDRDTDAETPSAPPRRALVISLRAAVVGAQILAKSAGRSISRLRL